MADQPARLPSNRCGQCQRWALNSTTGRMDCGVTGVRTLAHDGASCKLFLRNGTKTVRIRVYAVVDTAGEWSAAGWSPSDADVTTPEAVARDMQEEANRSCDRFSVVDAEVPLPVVDVVQGMGS